MSSIDLIIYEKTKNHMIDIKKKKDINLSVQTKAIFSFYRNMQLEELIIIISNEFKSFDQETNFSTLTIAEKFIKEELFYFKSIYPAINSKIPKLKYKQMILLLFNDFHKNIII